MLFGVDVSSHQAPGDLDWHALARTHRFVIVRATYGTRQDARAAEHVARAQDAGLTVGLYHFFRPQQPAADQLAAFGYVAQLLGMGADWICPALDVEKNERYDGPFTPERYVEPCEVIAEAFKRLWDGCLVYINPAGWADLEEPGWVSRHHLWIAHHNASVPDAPAGMQWAIWQRYVRPLPGVYNPPPHAEQDIDQNIAREPLPLIAAKLEPETEPAPTRPEMIPLELDLDELRAERDRTIREDSDDD